MFRKATGKQKESRVEYIVCFVTHRNERIRIVTPEEIFGRQLKNIRKEKKVTQEALGKAVGVHTGTVSHWENGKQVPDTSTIRRIADYFGVSIGELLGGTGYDAPYCEGNSDVKIEELAAQLKALSKESLQIIAPAIRAAYEMERKR